MVTRIFLFLALASACLAQALPSKEKFHLILLVGQSNMAGRGKVEEADKTPHPRVLNLNKEGQWVPAVDPLHFDKPAMVGVGLGKTFGTLYAEAHPDVTVGLIPCAVGGSPISSWEPGALDAATKTHPWDDMLKRARAALAVGTLKGILWHQGESDSGTNHSAVYEQKLHELITRFRSELKAEQLPFIVGQMGIFPDAPWSEGRKLVNAAHESLPGKVALTGFAKADGLGHKGDKVHFNTEAFRELGRRYYAEFSKLAK